MTRIKDTGDKYMESEALQRWLTFLEKDISKEVLEELMEMEPAIKMAEEKLDFLSSDPEMIELYKAREYSAHERANILATGEGRGEKKAKIEVAKNLIIANVDIAIIMASTGFTEEEIQSIREEL